MNTCKHAADWMQGLLDGELAPADTEKLRQHLDLCADCQALWEALAGVEQMLASPPMASVPSGFAQRTIARLRASNGAPSASRTHLRVGLWAILASGIVLIVLLWWGALLVSSTSPLFLASSSAVLSGVSLLGEALATVLRALMHTLVAVGPACRLTALGAAAAALLMVLMGLGTGIHRTSARA